MEIIIHINSKKLDKDYEQAAAEYIKRTSPFCRVRLAFHRSLEEVAVGERSFVYAVRAGSDTVSSEGLAEAISKRNLEGYSRLELLVYDDSSPAFPDLPALCITPFALSQDLTVCVLTEQIYRAFTILNNITYHK